MPDKIVNHFVLADGSTAKYDAGALLNLDDTVSLAGYAPDAKAVGDRFSEFSISKTINALDLTATGQWAQGGINPTGGLVTSNETVRCGNVVVKEEYATITFDNTLQVAVFVYTGETTSTFESKTGFCDSQIDVSNYAEKYIRLLVRNKDGTALAPSDMSETDVQFNIIDYTDKTLTLNGKPADAKTVGDRFSEFSISKTIKALDLTATGQWTQGGIKDTGGLATSNETVRSGNIVVQESYKTITFDDALQVAVFVYSGETTSTFEQKIDYADFDGDISAFYGKYIRLLVRNKDRTALTPSAMSETSVQINAIEYTDTTLTMAGKPADAKVVGDRFSELDGIKVCAEFRDADFGLMQKGAFYRGVESVNYGLFNFNTDTDTLLNAFDDLALANQEYITKKDLGACSDGVHHIYMYELSPVLSTPLRITYKETPTIFILSGQHGYEKASPFALYYLLYNLINNYQDSPILMYLRSYVNIVFVPVANPYGFDNKTYKNANSVNLNRNWASGWEFESDETSDNYAGLAPFDQPETLAISDEIADISSKLSLFVDFHTNGHQPAPAWENINAILPPPKNNNIYQVMFDVSRQHIKETSLCFNKQYSLGTSDSSLMGYLYPSSKNNGLAKDWVAEQGVLSTTFEGFAGFVGGSRYTDDVIRANEELVTNFIFKLLCRLSEG